MEYDTPHSLRRAIDRRLKHKLSDDEWAAFEPRWAPPYDNGDVAEVVAGVRLATSAEDRKSRLPVRIESIRALLKPQTLEQELVSLMEAATILRLVSTQGSDVRASILKHRGIAREYERIGRAVHLLLSVHTIGREFAVPPAEVLEQICPPEAGNSIKSEIGLPKLIVDLVFGKPADKAFARISEGLLRGLESALRAVQLGSEERRRAALAPFALMPGTWEERRLAFEAEYGAEFADRPYGSWRAFRTAVLRAAQSAR